MSEARKRLLQGTSKPITAPALLVLEDGTAFSGYSCAAEGEVFGEICFNTAMVGYLEAITDPAYAGKILTMTYPQIGNYGVNLEDAQAEGPALQGLVVRDLCTAPSNWRCEMTLPEYLTQKGVVAIEGIDTRALVRHIRDNGAMRAVISTTDVSVESLIEKVRAAAKIEGANLVEQVSCKEPTPPAALPKSHEFAILPAKPKQYRVVAYDLGARESQLHSLVREGCDIISVPWNTPAEDVLATKCQAVFLSSGPGDARAATETIEQVAKLIGKVPVFAVDLGFQVMGLAAGGALVKLKHGHCGANQPVKNLITGNVEITPQNHGFALDFSSLGALVPELSGGEAEHKGDLRFWAEQGIAPVVQNERFGRIQLTHVNLNDGTAEGIAFLDVPALGIQYHPESCAGPTSSHYMLLAFIRMIAGDEGYLTFDTQEKMLAGWDFGLEKGDN